MGMDQLTLVQSCRQLDRRGILYVIISMCWRHFETVQAVHPEI